MRHANRRGKAGFTGTGKLLAAVAGLSVASSFAPPAHAAWHGVTAADGEQAGDTTAGDDRSGATWHQDGLASYYGARWTGRRTSSGDRFDPRKLTAAHASLPLGTHLLVTSESSGESVVVTVNDREPDHGRRIIDLSPEAARRLHMLGAGVADVEISALSDSQMRARAALDGRVSGSDQDDEVAEAPDDDADQDVALPVRAHRAAHAHVSHARHGQPHRLHARR